LKQIETLAYFIKANNNNMVSFLRIYQNIINKIFDIVWNNIQTISIFINFTVKFTVKFFYTFLMIFHLLTG